MPTTVMRPSSILAHGRSAPHAPHRITPHRRRLFAAAAVLAAAVGVGAWALTVRLTQSNERTAVLAATWSGSGIVVDAAAFQNRLAAAGYSIRVTGVLDPVTKSAAADFLRVTQSQPLEPWLANALQGTVIRGTRDPVAWNERFGLNRPTRMVERPLTGPEGQLDAFGNLRWRP